MFHRKDITFSKPSIFREGIEEYASRVSTAPGLEAQKIALETSEKCSQWADIASNAIQARFLSMIVSMTGARRVLEVGTFTGHATVEIAAALPEDGTVTTIDSFVADGTAREIATSAFAASAHRDKIILLEMDALAALDQVGTDFDLIFIDADKPNYRKYFDKIIGEGILHRDGVLLVDNTLWGGRVLSATRGDYDLGTEVDGQEWVENMLNEWATHVIDFNAYVMNDPRVDNVMLTVHDGMTLIRHAQSN
jgi:caffeoyl-CoA O-methyltransferase